MSRDPLGKQALFSPPPGADPDDRNDDLLPGGEVTDGKNALFSAGPHRRGTVVVECSECLNHTRMSIIEAGVRIAFVSLWIPGKRYSRWMQCPECQRRTWCKIRWFG